MENILQGVLAGAVIGIALSASRYILVLLGSLRPAPKHVPSSIAAPEAPAFIGMESKGYFLNLGMAAAAGICHENGITVSMEADSGFVLTVMGDDAVAARFYNNACDGVRPASLDAQVGEECVHIDGPFTSYALEGYGNAAEGCYCVSVTLSNGYVLEAGVCKTGRRLYAANIERDRDAAMERIVFHRSLDMLLASHNAFPDTAVWTKRIYYPIVPTAWSDKTDVRPWLEQSRAICDPGWTDAHKVYALYTWCVDHLAYDCWVLDRSSGKQNSRAFYYNDFSGKYYASRTHTGVCGDFANILAIMCRQQQIPAVVVSHAAHGWTAVYLKDYRRWIAVDVTQDVKHLADKENPADVAVRPEAQKCRNLDAPIGGAGAVHVYIGNRDGMLRMHVKNPYK